MSIILLTMSVHKHFHIISGGESIGKTYPEIIREVNGITDVIIISNPLDEYRDKGRIEKEFATVRELSEKLKIRYHDPLFYQNNSFQDVINKVIELYKENSDAEFSFNITGGRKIQALALFRAADFMDANAYYVLEDSSPKDSNPKDSNPEDSGSEDSGKVILLTKCRLPAKDIGKNPNIPKLLRIIGQKEGSILRTELKREMTKLYTPIRNNNRKEQILKEGTFSVMLGQLLEWNLIEEGRENKRNKTYRIKDEGKIMLNMYDICKS